ncbi:fatty acid alpha-hydroxylase [Geranomyces variabilis]|nr:fatty acid alpha-hydroxylase [Geranomyces variabilis]
MMGSPPPPATATTTTATIHQLPVLSRAQVAQHNTAKSVWLIVRNKVYDVSQFMFDHPGGEELLLQYGGQDVTAVMQDELEHLHSDSAYDMLDEYCVGVLSPSDDSDDKKLSTSASLFSATISSASPSKQKNGVPTTSVANGSSNLAVKRPFIDYTKPMLMQMLRSDYSKAYYLEQVHIPRHAHGSAPLFGPWYLEMLSLTPWWVIPIVWIPLWSLSIYIAANRIGITAVAQLMPLGVLLWSFIEYTLHRFVFHVENILPDHRVALSLHFVLHGIHHFLPMDRMRLVMPPALSIALAYGLWCFFSMFLPLDLCFGLATGVIAGYVGYDLIHYYLHHGRPFAEHLREMKSYHLDHHYKDANLGYGITSKLWDRVFGTVLW